MLENKDVTNMVNFFKALADPVRLRIVGLLANEAQCGQELATTLQLSPSTVTHHLRMLKRTGLVREVPNHPYTEFHLEFSHLQDVLRSVVKKERVKDFAAGPDVPREKRRVINAFFAEGKLKSIPSQRRKKEIVFEEILRLLPLLDEYPERLLSQEIQKFHSDFCTIRREFIMGGYMERESGIYRLTARGRSAATLENVT